MPEYSDHDTETILGPSVNRESILLMPGAGVSVEVNAQLLEDYSQTYREHVNKPSILGFNFRGFEDITLQFFAQWLSAAPRDNHNHNRHHQPQFIRGLLDLETYEECVAAWRFGRIMQVREFQNDVLRLVLHYYRDCEREVRFDPLEVAPLLATVPRQSAIYRLLVDITCHFLERLLSDEVRRTVLAKLERITLLDICSRVLLIGSGNGGLPLPGIQRYI